LGAVSEHLDVGSERAMVILEHAAGGDLERPERPSIYKAALSLGVPDELIAKHQHRHIKPERFLVENQRLIEAIKALSKVTNLGLLTNTRTEIAKRALSSLGLYDCFLIVYGGDKLSKPKPNVSALLQILNEFRVLPRSAVAVGDRWPVDLEPAAELGMGVVHVRWSVDTIEWIERTLAGWPQV
jgi:FMN phosphatase YigB (HAD superfamily)